jgi:TPR repeat protein
VEWALATKKETVVMEQLINKAESFARKKKYKEAFALLEEADKHNDPVASYALGTWYLHGTYVAKNFQKAVDYLNKAAKGEVKEAFFDLAVCYEKGIGVRKNLRKAFENYLAASQLGDKEALYEVVRCFYYGIGVEENRSLSELLYNKVFRLQKRGNRRGKSRHNNKAVFA